MLGNDDWAAHGRLGTRTSASRRTSAQEAPNRPDRANLVRQSDIVWGTLELCTCLLPTSQLFRTMMKAFVQPRPEL